MTNELIERSKKKAKGQDTLLPILSSRKLTKDEIATASDAVRANLVIVILKISNKLATIPDNAVGLQNLAQLAKLTDTAAKLFSWPGTKPLDPSQQKELTSPVVNLALIRTTPEQLRAAAKAEKQAQVTKVS